MKNQTAETKKEPDILITYQESDKSSYIKTESGGPATVESINYDGEDPGFNSLLLDKTTDKSKNRIS